MTQLHFLHQAKHLLHFESQNNSYSVQNEDTNLIHSASRMLQQTTLGEIGEISEISSEKRHLFADAT